LLSAVNLVQDVEAGLRRYGNRGQPPDRQIVLERQVAVSAQQIQPVSRWTADARLSGLVETAVAEQDVSPHVDAERAEFVVPVDRDTARDHVGIRDQLRIRNRRRPQGRIDIGKRPREDIDAVGFGAVGKIRVAQVDDVELHPKTPLRFEPSAQNPAPPAARRVEFIPIAEQDLRRRQA
jgi:hypothetical protein